MATTRQARIRVSRYRHMTRYVIAAAPPRQTANANHAILDAVEFRGTHLDYFGRTETQSTVMMSEEIYFARSNALCCTPMHFGALYCTINAYSH